jgi:hypothetical protein
MPIVRSIRPAISAKTQLSQGTKTVSPASAISMLVAAFDLQLPEDCYLSLLTPFTSVMIAIFPETKVNGTSAISDLRTVRVRGWLFYFNDELAIVADALISSALPYPRVLERAHLVAE